eukprot:1066550-Rhodomonas_salina.2
MLVDAILYFSLALSFERALASDGTGPASFYGCVAAVYGCTAPVYGCTAPVYGCTAPIYGRNAALHARTSLRSCCYL